jgi:branched-chain amino acid transport system ATP-binding protein
MTTPPDEPRDPVLSVEAVTAGYGSQPIIFDVSFQAEVGTVTTVIGPNGAGKSTLFKALFGVARLFAGTIKVKGQPIEHSTEALVRSGVAYVPQIQNVFPSLTVNENLEIGTFVRGKGDFERVFSLFPDLKPVRRMQARKLSGGQRNMLAVGRALMSSPDVLLLDEATGGLSPLLARKLWEHVVELAKQGVAVVAIEQNVRLALEHSGYVYVLAGGRNHLNGTPAELSARPDFAQLFLEATEEPASGASNA